MKPQLHRLPIADNTSFFYSKYECNYYERPWHFHKEFELVLITKSTGKKFIGNRVHQFEAGDLTLIGSDVPHLFRNDDYHYDAANAMQASSIFIHFTEDFLGDKFFHVPEMKLVKRILEKSSLGLHIIGTTQKKIAEKLHSMQAESGSERLLSLLQILLTIAQSSEVHTILATGFSANHHGDTDKINKVFEYIMMNYKKEIYVTDIAAQLNMSVASFSRYFKNHTRKTFLDYVTEIRIGHACKLLMENNHSVSEIGYMSGFENMSNFYRHFKKHIGIIPKEYKNRFINHAI